MIFPLAALPLTLVIDGTVVRSYMPAYVVRGRVFAPVDPLLTAIATRLEYDPGMMIVVRGDRFAQIPVRVVRMPNELNRSYVAVAPVLRTLGLAVSYDAASRVLDVRTPGHAAIAEPTPFNPAVPRASPSAVFTPEPVATPRPVFSGKPTPRRTPIPYATRRPHR